MLLDRVFPFVPAPANEASSDVEEVAHINPSTEDKLDKLRSTVKPRALAQGFHTNIMPNWWKVRKSGFEKSTYDFNKITEAVDTDSYVKQAFLKYKDLFWKEGWDIVGENPEAINYLHQRIDLIEEAMGRPFNQFLSDAVDQWIKYGNVFIAKCRGPLRPFYNIPGENLVVGYELLPTDKIRIKRDVHNQPIQYRQEVNDDSGFTAGRKSEPTWEPDEVIHLFIDRKPGYLFGTPYIIGALDDVIAVRMIEQDLLEMIHREMYPLYLYKVGTEKAPANQDEIDEAFDTIESMKVDGALVLSDRHDVDVIGAQQVALDIKEYLNHFKEKVSIGLGVYPHHLGISSDGTNRSATDRLDTALYDRIKLFQMLFEELMRFHVFNELLREGGFKPITTPKANGVSDRCFMRFKEIDIDTQVKKDTHVAAMFAGNLITLEEARLMLGLSDDIDPNMLLMALTARVQTIQQIEVLRHQPQTPKTTASGGTAPAPKKPDAATSSTGVVPNLPNGKKGPGNVIRPSNQFGRRTSPNIRHNDDTSQNINETIDMVVELLSEFDQEIENNE